jgi:aspartate-semialdehyde dehydrogenase
MKKINVGVVGATGVVGETFLSLMEEREFPAGEVRLFASSNSEGQTRRCQGRDIPVTTLKEGCFNGLDLVFFSSGDDISKEWAPKAVKSGAFAVDNSAAFRMDPNTVLIVPEVNAEHLPKRGSPAVIANPNCSTIQLVVALQPLAKRWGLKRVHVASYQSVSGAGRDGIEELIDQTKLSLEGEEPVKGKTFPAPIAFNSIPQIGRIGDDGFCTEETKIMSETCKILGRPNLQVSAFTVRVPTLNAHAEAVWVTLENSNVTPAQMQECLASAEGIEFMQPGERPEYPTQVQASGRDPVFVGRIRRDPHDPNTWLMWVVSDNLRKGAALNGIQIAERIFDLA